MKTFEEFITEMAQRVPSQPMGYDDKYDNKKMFEYLLDNSRWVKPLDQLNVNELKMREFNKGDVVRINLSDFKKKRIVYESYFVKGDLPNTLQQTFVWRDIKVKDTRGVVYKVIFEYILKQYNLQSDIKQTIEGTNLWMNLLTEAHKRGMETFVYNSKTKQKTVIEKGFDKEDLTKTVIGGPDKLHLTFVINKK